ncbi:MAG: hypothetical protein IKU14_06030 [Rhodocyclaceae bacterium]|nr:hypothetical protein [Rhodocyclaceae bacterium]
MLVALFLLLAWCLGRAVRAHRRQIERVVNSREKLADDLLREQFQAEAAEWAAQLRALKDVAKALSLCYARLRPEDDLGFLANQHALSGDALLEFEHFIARRAKGKDGFAQVRNVGDLVRLLAQLGY